MKKCNRVFAATVFSIVAQAGYLWAGGVGTAGAQFLKVGIGARAVGMAGAFSAVADDAGAIYWNPAGLAQLNAREVSATYNSYIEDTVQGNLLYAHPVAKNVTCGLGVDFLQVKDIEKRAGDTDTPDSTFSTSDIAVTFTHARGDLINNVYLGLNLKYIRSKLDTKTAGAFALDLGGLYHSPGQKLKLALNLQNIGTKMKFVSDSDPLPLNVKAGISWRMLEGKSDTDEFENEKRLSSGATGRLTLGLDFDNYLPEKRYYQQIGLEYWPVSLLALRAGYQAGHDKDSAQGFSAGLGLGMGGVSFDYAYMPFGDLGNTNRVSLGYRF